VKGCPKKVMEKLIQSKDTYNKIFQEGGFQGAYDLPYWQSGYYPLFKSVLKGVLRRRATKLLEVGCGPGAFAHLAMDKSSLVYRGFDFSEIAIEKARARTGRWEAFCVGDATLKSSYEGYDYDCIVCTEVLEHIEEDLVAISHWKPGTICECSVPNFDSETHVRFFKSEGEVERRYGKLIDIETIIRIKKPVLSDISLANTVREIRWKRYDPKRVMAILGFGSFDSLGGWFLFSGRTKA